MVSTPCVRSLFVPMSAVGRIQIPTEFFLQFTRVGRQCGHEIIERGEGLTTVGLLPRGGITCVGILPERVRRKLVVFPCQLH